MKAINATMEVVHYVVFNCDELFIVDKLLLCNVNVGKDFHYHIFGPSC
jgi:hypothetical protein